MEYQRIQRIVMNNIENGLLEQPSDFQLTRDFIDNIIQEAVDKYDKAEYKNELTRDCFSSYERDLKRPNVEVVIPIVGVGAELHCGIHRRSLPRYDAYLRKLEKSIGIEPSLKLEKSIDEIFNRIYFDGKDDFTTKGLVIGHVQSGKTSNFIGLASKAIDIGYRIVIILTSNNSALRTQTQRRLNKDLIGYTTLFPNDKVIDWGIEREQLDKFICPITRIHYGYHRMRPISITDKEDFKKERQTDGILKLAENSSAIFLIVKKHATSNTENGILNKLNKWFKKDADTHGKIGLPCLIIDDECDASTPNSHRTTRGIRGEGDVSSVHGKVSELVNVFSKVSYVGYTATPFANIFMDKDANTSLYPRDFIVSLPRPLGYMGDEEFFANGNHEVFKELAENDLIAFCDVGSSIPNSAKKAIIRFLASRMEIVARVASEDFSDLTYDPSSSMIIHVSKLLVDHRIIFNKVKRCVNSLKPEDIWLEYVRLGNRNVNSYNDFLNIYNREISKLEILEVNGNGVSLDYGETDHPFLICVGGDIISRGLTIEGLISSYYLRESTNYDSLLQMGRWFGFRRGYDDLVQLYTTIEIFSRFAHLVEVNQQLREVIEDYSIDPSKTPANLAPAVLAHESMMPTGRMGAALDVRKVDGMLFQTLYFNKDELDFNYNLATEFINNNRILISRDNLDPSSQISGELIARFVCDYSYGDGGNSTVRQNLDIVKMRVNQLSGKQWDVTIHSLKGEGYISLAHGNILPAKRTLISTVDGFKAGVITDPGQTQTESSGNPRLVIYFMLAKKQEVTDKIVIGFSIRFPKLSNYDAYYQQIFN
jgi:hypothetical protein